jgi:N-ethylmaleimide reductase
MTNTPTMLLTPLALGPALSLPNRVVMAPMTRRRADASNVPSPLAAEYYAQRASAGLVIGEATLVGKSGASSPGSPGIYSDVQERAWSQIAQAVHAAGGRMFLQLWHAGRFSDPAFLDGEVPVAPSAIAIDGELETSTGRHRYVTPRALAADEIASIVEAFADAAARAIRAGCDGVEIHAAQGYLVDQFLRDGSNQRTDEWGGDLAGRSRLLVEIVAAASARIGSERIGVQLSPTSPLGGMRDSDPRATFGHAALRLAEARVAYLHLFDPHREWAELRAMFPGAIIANGGYDAASAAAAIERGDADLVSFGRPFIANPDLVERIAGGIAFATPDPSTFYGGGARGYTDYARLTGR